MAELAARAAVEIDRLVLGINRQVGPRHGTSLMAIAGDVGLDSLALIPHLGEFWLQRPVPIELAEARMPYAAPGAVASRIAAFESLGLLTPTGIGDVATERFRPLLRASIAAREDVVRETWAEVGAAVSEVDPLLTRVADGASDDHVVAVAHRGLEPADDPLHRFYGRLVTLRYVRQHDHVAAWSAAGLDAAAAVALTSLWHESEVEDGPGVEALERVGLVSGGAITPNGRRLREEIEEETNRRAAASWAVLSPDEHVRLNDVLSELPSR